MTIVALVAGAMFLGAGAAASFVGPDREPEQNEIDLD